MPARSEEDEPSINGSQDLWTNITLKPLQAISVTHRAFMQILGSRRCVCTGLLLTSQNSLLLTVCSKVGYSARDREPGTKCDSARWELWPLQPAARCVDNPGSGSQRDCWCSVASKQLLRENLGLLLFPALFTLTSISRGADLGLSSLCCSLVHPAVSRATPGERRAGGTPKLQVTSC